MGSPEKDSPKDRCRREIEELHQFFEDWLRGHLPKTPKAFDRVERALTPEFRLIHPSGEWRGREEILSGLRRAHGSRPDLTIEIREPKLLQERQETLLASYQEWQKSETPADGRISTVVFGRYAEAPNGLRWTHVHETWIQAPKNPNTLP